ncbi:hypothetical protein VPCG_00032 [Vibrio phage martha 12B12]|uniref:hypothetical protein n=1 Tax=Vibrio phage martha 12B12 TaxID=573175 RepID=UPI0002C054FE|nr:hypothetical protein [Vibrio sp. 10N.261.46.F12]YP_007877533.1 hypothetical protein VPCG_00032 [Vibrio phage martha 12B12]AGG58143.1 hypothetical protein VPCG_00032 [Vibrio phage martha 12B12]EKO3919734.1 hypothetical protein [Vibrio metschnikovii]PMM64184.1 hypothetical protein BCT48_21880 [Vibrio sp. 10N.261.46.F12]
MKAIALLLSSLFCMPVLAKDLPPVNEMLHRLDVAGYSNADKWEDIEGTKKQDLETGTLFVSQSSVSSMIPVNGSDDNELVAAFTLAGIHCVKTSLEAIDMAHHTSLPKSMFNSINDALRSPSHKASTLVWGYDFETEITPVKQGIIVNCTLK